MPLRTRVVALTVGLAAVSLLTACVSGTPDPGTSSPAADPAGEPTLAPNPPEPDSILWIRATATASNGAELSLEAMLHRALSYEYPGSQTMNQIIIDDCGATLTNAILTAEAWSINRMNITAIPPEGSAEWPTGESVGVRPSGDMVYVAGRGILQADPATGDLACVQDKVLSEAGRGAIAVGIPGDTIDLDNFNGGWTRHTWGFTTSGGVVLSDCSFELTDLGSEVGGGGSDWVEVADDANCYIGSGAEAPVF